MATITGTTGNDILNGTSGDDTLDGGRGADTLNGGAGDDILWSGDIYTDSGYTKNEKVADVLNGGDGDDTICSQGGADIIDGGAGTDTLAAYNDQQTNLDAFTYSNVEVLVTGSKTYTGTADKFEAFDSIQVTLGSGSLNSPVSLTLSAAGTLDIADELHWIQTTATGDVDRWRAATVNGSSGNDTITTGVGADTLYGNDGADCTAARK